SSHNQFIKDPEAHFRAIPWCAAHLNNPTVLNVVVPDRRPLPSGESNFVRRIMSSGTTVRACVSFLQNPSRRVKTSSGSEQSLSKSTELLKGGGAADGETRTKPFLLCNALLDLGEDMASYAGTMHGGLFTVLMDEVMGTAANFQCEKGPYTVQLNTKYIRPIKLPQIVLVRGRVVRKNGRKIVVRGTIEDKDGNIMAEADGLWIDKVKEIGRSVL
ncbi:HotDog domain containing protein, partial [Naviculisporaceae sp. PSN 640]